MNAHICLPLKRDGQVTEENLLLGKVQKKKFILQSTIVLDLEKPG
jgi:hypothetical protein